MTHQVDLDLNLLAQKPVKIGFEEVVFNIPPEPTMQFSTEMLLCRKKMQKAKTEEQQLNSLKEMVTVILSQDELHSRNDIEHYIGKMHDTQIVAIFNIYEDQIEKNKQNPN